MDDVSSRFLENLIGRTGGPFSFRFLFQPLMAIVYATRDGLRDARTSRPPYLRTLITCPDERRALLLEGCTAVGRVIVLGIIMDFLYQVIVFRWIYPGEMVVVVLFLTFVPYLLLRGPVNRIARFWIYRTRRPA
jgi:hypothetical protein